MEDAELKSSSDGRISGRIEVWVICIREFGYGASRFLLIPLPVVLELLISPHLNSKVETVRAISLWRK